MTQPFSHEVSHRLDCHQNSGDEDELVAACQDVMDDLEKGEVSREEVKKARSGHRQVFMITVIYRLDHAVWSLGQVRHNEASGMQHATGKVPVSGVGCKTSCH